MATRRALPQNYVKSPGTLLEDFEAVEDWTVISGSIEANTTEFCAGTQSIKMTTPSGSHSTIRKTISAQMNSGGDLIDLWIYQHTAANTFNGVSLSFSSTANFSKEAKLVRGLWMRPGWNRLSFRRSEFALTGGESWDNLMILIQIRVDPASATVWSGSFDSMYWGVDRKAKAIITFDDGWEASYTNALPILESFGFKCTSYVITSSIDAAGYMSLAQLQDAYSRGVDVANHTKTHQNLSTLSYNDQLIEIGDAKAWLAANGFTRGANHFAYTYDAYNADTLAILDSLGYQTARIGPRGIQEAPMADSHMLIACSVSTAVSLATAKTYIDRALQFGSNVIFIFHDIAESPSSAGYTIANFTAFMQYLYDFVVSGKIDVMTMDEWYNGLTNPRYRSLPVGRA